MLLFYFASLFLNSWLYRCTILMRSFLNLIQSFLFFLIYDLWTAIIFYFYIFFILSERILIKFACILVLNTNIKILRYLFLWSRSWKSNRSRRWWIKYLFLFSFFSWFIRGGITLLLLFSFCRWFRFILNRLNRSTKRCLFLIPFWIFSKYLIIDRRWLALIIYSIYLIQRTHDWIKTFRHIY